MEHREGERLGEFLVRIAVITEEQVKIVLEEQKKRPDVLFGQIAIEFGFINEKAVDDYLASRGLS
ncbi:MAG: hypothetical protein JW760_05650 [Spirochaetales bacterium]|nr:hypothetical protein [Spirochaetales bacterium]